MFSSDLHPFSYPFLPLSLSTLPALKPNSLQELSHLACFDLSHAIILVCVAPEDIVHTMTTNSSLSLMMLVDESNYFYKVIFTF